MIERYDLQASIVAFLIAFVAAGVFAILFKVIYQTATPYHERTLIREGNVAAAITLGAALLGYILVLASALEHTVSLVEFTVWALVAGVIQIAAVTIVRKVVMPDFGTASCAGNSPPRSIWPASRSASASSTPPASRPEGERR
jgi:putative membrane protein